jgi:hypothetical protein
MSRVYMVMRAERDRDEYDYLQGAPDVHAYIRG